MNLSKWDQGKVSIWIITIAAAMFVVFFGFSLIFAHSRFALIRYSILLATPAICIFFGVYQYRLKHPLRLNPHEPGVHVGSDVAHFGCGVYWDYWY